MNDREDCHGQGPSFCRQIPKEELPGQHVCDNAGDASSGRHETTGAKEPESRTSSQNVIPAQTASPQPPPDGLKETEACTSSERVNPGQAGAPQQTSAVTPGATVSSDKGAAAADKRPRPKICQKKNKLRKDILSALVKLKLITNKKAVEVFLIPKDLEPENLQIKSKINNYLGGLKLEKCFNEFINFKCESTTELYALVHEPLNAADHGFESFEDVGLESEVDTEEDEDYDYDDEDKEDEEDEDPEEEEEDEDEEKLSKFDRLTVLDLLQKNAQGDIVYFSFCWDHPTREMCSWHCSRCHTCRDCKERHCYNCDTCSYGSRIPECGSCGVRSDEYGYPLIDGKPQVIRPAFETRRQFKKKASFLSALHLPLINAIDVSSDSDEEVDDYYHDHKQLLNDEERKAREVNKGWIFSDEEDDIIPSPLKL